MKGSVSGKLNFPVPSALGLRGAAFCILMQMYLRLPHGSPEEKTAIVSLCGINQLVFLMCTMSVF
jgi:hypothetical protein